MAAVGLKQLRCIKIQEPASKNPESLDSSIQSALSALFPPFEATAPIVLSQLFRTIEERYHGDALQCLLDFLIPSKHLLESVQQAACAGYSDVVFRCEGWPLCLHDKTVIQLAPVNPLLLRPGDFYLQVEPFGDQAARIVLKSLLEEGCREVEETPVPETSYPCIFTDGWLQDINEGRHGTPLSRCLLCTDQGVIKLPWAKIAIPEFLDKPKIMPTHWEAPPEPKSISVPSHFNSSTLPVGAIIIPAKDRLSASVRTVDCSSKLVKMKHERQMPKSCSKPLIKPVGWVSPNTWDSRNYGEIEGDYVDLVDIAKGKVSVHKQRDSHPNPPNSALFKPVRPPPPIPLGPSVPCGRTLQYAEEPCMPCSQRKLGQELTDQDLKCRYRDSYLAALRNPVTFERGSRDLLSALEEVGLCAEGELRSKGTYEAPTAPIDELGSISNHSKEAVIRHDLCQYKPCCEPTPGNFVSHRKDLPTSSASENLMKESPTILKSTPGLSQSQRVQTKLISQQLGHNANVQPGSDVFLEAREGDMKPQQKVEVLKPSGKHKVKLRSLSTVSETPKGSPLLYKLNNRSQSDVCPETISSIIQCKKGELLDQVIPKQERLAVMCPKKGERGRCTHTQFAHCYYFTQSCVLCCYMIEGPLNMHTKQTEDPPTVVWVPWQFGCIRVIPITEGVNGNSMLLPNENSHSGKSETYTPTDGADSRLHNSKTEKPSSPLVRLPSASSDTPPSPQSEESSFRSISGLLESAIICLPGSRDRTGRAVVEVHGDRKGWTSPLVSTQTVCKLLLYLHSIPRKDVRELGMTLVVNARKKPPPLHLYKALLMAQEQALHTVHSIVILMDKDTCPRPEKQPGLQMDMVTSMKALNKTVEASQLTSDLGGTFTYSHSDWMQFHQKLVSFMTDLREADRLLQKAIRKVDGCKKADTAQDVQQCIQEQKASMKEVLEDTRLVTLQREGGAALARMRREEFRFPQSEDYRDGLESVTSLYNQVEEKLHTLVMRSNESLQQLEFLFRLRETEAKISTAGTWFNTEGEQRLADSYTTDDTLVCTEKALQHFEQFLTQSKEKHQFALTLVTEAEGLVGTSDSSPATDVFRTLIGTFKSNMDGIMLRAEKRYKELDTLVHVYRFCYQASALAKECSHFLEQVEPGCYSAQTLNTLQMYEKRLGGEFSTVHFQALKVKACGVGSGASGVIEVWNATWVQCQEVRQRLEETQKKTGVDKHQIQQTTAANSQMENGGTEKEGEDERPLTKRRPREHHSEADLRITECTEVCDDFPLHKGLGRSLSEGSYVSAHLTSISGFSPLDVRHKHCQSRLQPLEKNLQPFQNLPISHDGSLQKLQKIMEELLSTEREYVKALGYVREHYFPELERADVPQDLRGQRGSIFGNLEKLHDFHQHHFMSELESCVNEPFRVGRCFLRHRESFALYALYSKNKPQSDSLLINHGQVFFKQKQLRLGDKMDLWSYLLKPVQRISKYSLLLQDMLRECGPGQTREMAEVKAALEIIHFQLRHGNNLLAMDAIHNCDVNLKEQGQLIRQDEFLVTLRKKKCFRHIFLFQELILFSKTRKTDVGNDTYIYKQSFKTSDIGMTQNSGDSGLCFEIWFRKRKTQDTYVLQAVSREVKEAWTKDLERILWEQAVHNRDVRMQERVFMGIGNKPFMDIQPSEAAISDRAVNYVLMGRVSAESKVLSSAGSCGSQDGLSGGRPTSVGSGSSSSSSSSSGGSTVSHMGYRCGPKRRAVVGLLAGYVPLEEDDLDHESGSQHLLLDSSESSGESVSGFSSCSHGYHSAAGGEVEDASSVCASVVTVKEAVVGRGTEAPADFHKPNALAGSPDKTQPPVAPKPKPQHQAKDLPCGKETVQNTSVGKSTEV
ncbi:pleckstrin -likey domain containing family G (with RhoGef domain) member 4 [Scophthalmus maximus]|uniref:Pleckstrin-likey domain containing family G (With RhoGef domain) member 4 n=1 Tax=Scophthalmus maximus TaxID=52904 RepID=A0A2U9BGN2_SCOMX|nr:pleckstrin -likey domain containing family G (with RhoGef domain) member 4 [Scophthalmus maximus]